MTDCCTQCSADFGDGGEDGGYQSYVVWDFSCGEYVLFSCRATGCVLGLGCDCGFGFG